MVDLRRSLSVLALGAIVVPATTDTTDPPTSTDVTATATTDAPVDGGQLVTDGLGRLPAEALGEQPMIVVADLDAASEAAGLTRPTEVDDPEGQRWLASLTGRPADDGSVAPVFVPLPQQFIQVFDPAAFADVFGWSILDVGTIAAAESPPLHFSVVGDDFADDTLPAGLTEVADGVVTDRDGEDFEQDLSERDPAIDQLGRPQRLAVADGHIAISTSTPAVEAWLAGDATTAADDPRLAAVAGALDDAGAVSALIVPMAPGGAESVLVGADVSPAELERWEAELAEVALDRPFDAVGLGWSTDEDGAPVITLAYHFGDASAAETAAPAIETMFAEGDSLVTRAPLSETVIVDGVVAEAEVAIATLSPGPEGRPQTLYQMLFQRDLPFVVIG